MSESQIMSANNDLMDPNWKPNSPKERESISRIKNSLDQLELISMRFDKWSEEELDNLEKDGMGVSCHFTIEQIKKIRKAVNGAL